MKVLACMWLIVGLGNPGAEYQYHRHNVGFMVVDEIASRFNFPPFKSKFSGQVSQHQISGEKVCLLKPQTFMNNSGESVQKAAKFFQIPEEKIIVIYDELDLPLGKLRVRKGGGNGGHNGIRSIDQHMPSKDYWRIRVGIDHPGSKERVTGHVLGNFSKQDELVIEEVIYTSAKLIDIALTEKLDSYASKVAVELKARLEK